MMRFNLKAVLFISFFAFISIFLSKLSFFQTFHISALIIAIILGMLLTNLFKVKLESFHNELAFATKNVLRFAIILYGFRLTFQEILNVGFLGITTSIIIVSSTLLLGLFIGKLLKLDFETTLLTSAGSAICGAAAVMATEGVLKNKEYKSTIAVSTVVLFGTISMFLYPLMYEYFDFKALFASLYIGGTLHEVAHVVGASNSVANEFVQINAVVVKMLRVMLIAPFLIILAFYLSSKQNNQKKKISFPYFALFFILVAVFNSFSFLSEDTIFAINIFDDFLLCVAMFSLGLKTEFKSFKKAGIKPILLATILFLYLVIGGYFIISFLIKVF